jgi:hypothetical protein
MYTPSTVTTMARYLPQVKALAGAAFVMATMAFSASSMALTLTQNNFAAGSSAVTVTAVPGPAAGGTFSAGAFSGKINGSIDFISYCIEIGQYFSFGQLYSNYSSIVLTGTPAPSPYPSTTFPLNAAKVADLSSMLGTWYSDSLLSAVKTAAMQTAIWEIVYDTGRNLTSGAFIASGGTSVDGQAQTYLNSSNWTPPAAGLIALVSPNNQDWISIRSGPLDGTVQIPVPSSLPLLAAGLLFCALGIRRRNAAVLAV